MAWFALILLTALFVGLHFLPFAVDWRARLQRTLGGAAAYKLAYTVGSLVGLFGAFYAAGQAPVVVLWTTGDGLRWLALVLTLPAFILLASAYVGSGGPRLARHPMLAGIGLWAFAHLVSTGTLAHALLFGALALYAPIAMLASDRRDAARDPGAFAERRAATSLVPFAGLGRGGSPAPLGWRGPVVGVIAWLVFLTAHTWLFGVSPLPAALR